MDAVVFGNVTLDIICQTVDDVPRHESIAFDRVTVSPGGCGSNVAVGLAALSVSTALVARAGNDDASTLIRMTWERYGVDLRWLKLVDHLPTGTSVGLVDSDYQPRFIHTSGANATLTGDDIDARAWKAAGVRWVHIAGFFVLPGLLDDRLHTSLAAARPLGLKISLDVVRSPRLKHPVYLWPNLPYIDYFMCNENEGWQLTGEDDPVRAARVFRGRGAGAVMIKLGSRGCYVDGEEFTGIVPAPIVDVLDTTGAGDSFAAGFIAASLQGAGIEAACRAGNQAGARAVGCLGAITHWK